MNKKNKIKIKPTKAYSFGEVFINPYLGNKTTEVLNKKNKRIGWIWTHTDDKVVVSPHLGFYVWYGENGEEWTVDSAAMWLINKRS